MKKITEKKLGKESYFIVENIVSNTLLETKKVDIKNYIIEEKDKTYFLIYNTEMEVISDTFKFLNHRTKKLSFNSKRTSMYALKYLYSFSEIINTKIEDFTFENFVQLIYFLKGISSEGNDFTYDIFTKRSNKSINAFFSTYREYYTYLGYFKSPLFRERSMSGYIPSQTQYDLSKLTQSKSKQEVPKYISTEEFKKIIQYIRKNIKDKERRLRDECIIRIMYEGGLRLGEVLGSTLEDYVIEEVNDDEICFIYIRNRLTDKKYQSAKTCMNVFSKRTYESNDYKTKDVGYQLSFLNLDTYDLICEYIDLAHERAFKKCKKGYEKSKTDAIGEYKKNNEDNYYLFINSRGTPLSDTTWNEEIRQIFEAVGIPINYGVKEDNLNHRFRHGFIMHLIHDLKIPREKVMVRSRHKSYSSLDAYYNPTTSEIVKMKQEIEDKLLE